ncbi:DUF3105 domain-containing protein [Nocardioides sp. URHA0020]|uniref:DUF3105 domain-containing protein n=1 Tax=Nocardioides sp. URHA0020 TaxID=1380392 RepID=UPI00068797E9|nr:DUF3105 domain-containing protein [Nocardioides sp. URHA0020]
MSEIPPPPAYPPPGYTPPPSEPVLVSASGPEAPRPSRAPVIALAAVAVALVVALAVAVPMLVNDDAPIPRDLAAVKSYDDLETDHTTDPVDYPQSPPVGGPHNPVWLDCGVYDEPVPKENAVHDLEHGTVWISYDPDLDADDVATLTDALPQNGILAPYADLEAPVVITVWGRQLALDGADDPRLALFVKTYGGGETAPEPMASCAGGERDPGTSDDSGSGTEV